MRLSRWVRRVLARVLCNESLPTARDAALRVLVPLRCVKARRRDLERLPDTQKVDCVSVNLAPFKAAVDMLLQVRDGSPGGFMRAC